MDASLGVGVGMNASLSDGVPIHGAWSIVPDDICEGNDNDIRCRNHVFLGAPSRRSNSCLRVSDKSFPSSANWIRVASFT